MSQPDVNKVAVQLRSMQQDLRALEDALRQLADALTEEEEAQLSPEAKTSLQRLRDRTQKTNVALFLPKEASAKKAKIKANNKKEDKQVQMKKTKS